MSLNITVCNPHLNGLHLKMQKNKKCLYQNILKVPKVKILYIFILMYIFALYAVNDCLHHISTIYFRNVVKSKSM